MFSLTLAAALTTASLFAPTTHSQPGCAAPQSKGAARITGEQARQQINTLLASEGLTQVRDAVVQVRQLELDNDTQTLEALVDVLSPELCTATLECPTLVVQLGSCSELRTLGHGRWLQVLVSRTAGWADLAETALLPVARRALKFDAGRYR